MNKKLFKFSLFLILLFISPILVSAFGEDDDITYTATYDDKYTYGNVTKCFASSGSAYEKGIQNVSGKAVCVWTIEHGIDSFKCDDNNMEKFQVSVSGSDGETYVGYGCRKPNSNAPINYQQKELYVGYSDQPGDWTGDTCSIISGDSIAFGGQNCRIEAVKEGETKLRIINNETKVATYYNYKVLKAYQSISELDQNYNYGSVKECSVNLAGYSVDGEVSFDGLTFCGSSAGGYNYEINSLSCQDSGYEKFKLAFDSAGVHYKGYGCRQLKKTEEAEESVEYIKKTIYLGEEEDIADYYTHSCSVVSGDAGYFSEPGVMVNHCRLRTTKVGVVKVKSFHTETSTAKYYEYTVIEPAEEITELDNAYQYTDIKDCSIYVGAGYSGTYATTEFEIDGVKFCGSKFDHESVTESVECPTNYEKFPATFKVDGTIYYSFGCRKVLNNEEVVEPDMGEPVYGCEVIPDEIRDWIKSTLNLVKYVALALVIVLGILDFIKAAASGEADQMKKSGSSFMKRIIAVVILFLLPVIVDLVLNLIEIYGADSTCLPE